MFAQENPRMVRIRTLRLTYTQTDTHTHTHAHTHKVHHYIYIAKRLVWGEKGEGVAFKLQFLFKGPGWSPGKPRLGLRDDIPQVLNTHMAHTHTCTHCKLGLQVSPDEKPYDRKAPLWLNIYVAIHVTIVFILARVLGEIRHVSPILPITEITDLLFLVY